MSPGIAGRACRPCRRRSPLVVCAVLPARRTRPGPPPLPKTYRRRRGPSVRLRTLVPVDAPRSRLLCRLALISRHTQALMSAPERSLRSLPNISRLIVASLRVCPRGRHVSRTRVTSYIRAISARIETRRITYESSRTGMRAGRRSGPDARGRGIERIEKIKEARHESDQHARLQCRTRQRQRHASRFEARATRPPMTLAPATNRRLFHVIFGSAYERTRPCRVDAGIEGQHCGIRIRRAAGYAFRYQPHAGCGL